MIKPVHLTNTYLNDQMAQIRSNRNDLPVTLNESEGSTSNKSFVSIQLLELGPRQVKSTLDSCQYEGLPEFCYMSFASQAHGPVEIDSVDQLPNSSDQESAFDN